MKYTPQQHGVAEKKMDVEKASCLLIGANLPLEFCAETVNTAAVYVIVYRQVH